MIPIALVVESELRRLRSASGAWHLKGTTLPGLDKPLTCDISAGSPRPFVPFLLRQQLLDSLHGLSRPCISSSQPNNLSIRLVKHQIDVKLGGKIASHVNEPKFIATHTARQALFNFLKLVLKRIHLDIVGPSTESQSHKCILTDIDHFTRWPEAFPFQTSRF